MKPSESLRSVIGLKGTPRSSSRRNRYNEFRPIFRASPFLPICQFSHPPPPDTQGTHPTTKMNDTSIVHHITQVIFYPLPHMRRTSQNMARHIDYPSLPSTSLPRPPSPPLVFLSPCLPFQLCFRTMCTFHFGVSLTLIYISLSTCYRPARPPSCVNVYLHIQGHSPVRRVYLIVNNVPHYLRPPPSPSAFSSHPPFPRTSSTNITKLLLPINQTRIGIAQTFN